MFKIAFLFLTLSSIYHESHWLDFFRGNEQCYSVYIHSKELLDETSPFKQEDCIPNSEKAVCIRCRVKSNVIL